MYRLDAFSQMYRNIPVFLASDVPVIQLSSLFLDKIHLIKVHMVILLCGQYFVKGLSICALKSGEQLFQNQIMQFDLISGQCHDNGL